MNEENGAPLDQVSVGSMPPETTEPDVSHPSDSQDAEKAIAPKREAEPKSLRDVLKSAKERVLAEEAKTADKTAPPPERERDEQGRFKASETADPEQKPVKDAVKADEQPKEVVSSDVPSRFSANAKAAWAETPSPVRAEINRAIQEMETGLKEYQARFEPLKPYMQIAEQSGTTIQAALDNYMRIATALKDEPEAALQEMFTYAGINPQEWAAKLTGAQPDQALSQYQGTIQKLQSEIGQLRQQLTSVTSEVETRQNQEIQAEIEAFKQNAPRFEELGPIMARVLNAGLAETLQDAYDYADRLNPAAQPVAETPPAPPQAPHPRKATSSITGSPPSGSNPRYAKPAASIRESIERAKARVGI